MNRRAQLWLILAPSALVLIVAGIAIGYAVDRAEKFVLSLPGKNMAPTFQPGDRVQVDPDERVPARGDVIIFQDPNSPLVRKADSCDEVCFISRVIALPSETISVEEGKVFIDDSPLSEPYARLDTSSFGPVEVPERAYFVMGDNRAVSSDSRGLLGMIPQEAIVGTVQPN